MTDTHEIVIRAPVAIQRESIGTHPLVAMAMQRPEMLTPDSMQKMLDLQKQFEEMEAKRAFDADKINLMRTMPTVIIKDNKKSEENKRFESATLAHILETVEPHLLTNGFSKSWKTVCDGNKVTVSCVITHHLGHSESTEISAPPDNSGGKNPVQAIGSTVEYLKRYTLNCLLGITTKGEPDADTSPDRKDDDRVDVNKNLRSLSRLKSYGISKEKAEEFTGKPVEKWTSADLLDLGEMVKTQTGAENIGG